MLSALQAVAQAVAGGLPVLAVVAVAFTVLGLLAPPCNDTPPWWRKPDLATDLCYVLVLPALMHYGRIACLAAGLVLLGGGRHWLAALPPPVQVVAYLLLSDLWLYATHRLFHAGSLWRWHAVHHSSEQVEWISAQRFHPFDLFWHAAAGDCVLLLAGIGPAVLVWVAPFTIGMSALAHANVDWDFGPLRLVLASRVYHRWHHTGASEGGSRNFAANFPIFDLIFGTLHLPQGRRPQCYGVSERDVPADFVGQMLHPLPLRRRMR